MYPPSALRRLCSVLPLLFCTISCATTTTEDIEARAIIPTSSGMIGIWPPDYSPPSAINTADFSYSTSGTATESKWIGKESSWTSKSSSSTFYSVKISTVSDIPPAITGIAVADLYIEIPPEVSDIILKHAQIACGASAKAKREDGLEKRQNPCAASSSAARWAAAQSEFANGVANDPQFSSLLTDPFEHVPTFTANDIQRAVASIKLAGGAIVTTALRNKVAVSAIFFGLFAATGNIPLQAKVEKQSMANTAYPSTTPPVTTSTSTKSCKATGTVPPLCPDKVNCAGNSQKICETGKYEKCKCAGEYSAVFHTVSAKQYADNVNMAQAALAEYDQIVQKAATGHWCQHNCVQDFAPKCICNCGGTSYSEVASTTQDPLFPSPSPTGDTELFWWQPCPYISGDPNLSSIVVTQHNTITTPTHTPTTFPAQTPAASSHAAAGPPGNSGKAFNRDVATAAVKARCAQLAQEAKAPSQDWPGTCAVPNTDSSWDVPASGQGTGGCIYLRGQSDINFAMDLNTENELCQDAGYSKLTFNEDECNKSFQAIIDGMPSYTDMKSKWGGTFYSSGCWRYVLGAQYHCKGYANPCPEVTTKYCEAGWGDVCNS